MKKTVISLVIGSFLMGVDFSPYLAYITYSNATKKSASVIGAYFSQYSAPYKIELNGSYMYQDKEGEDSYSQTDITVLMHYFKGYNLDFKFALHNIFTSSREVTYTAFKRERTTIKGYDNVLYLGVLYYKYLNFNSGIDLYYSNYDDVKVYQATLKGGKNFGNFYSKIGSFYMEGAFNYIKLSNKDTTPKDKYLNFNLKLQNFKAAYTTTLKASIGKSAYKAEDSAMVVYNIGDEYKYSVGIGVSKKIEKGGLGVSYDYSSFVEDEKKAHSHTIVFSYFTFFK